MKVVQVRRPPHIHMYLQTLDYMTASTYTRRRHCIDLLSYFVFYFNTCVAHHIRGVGIHTYVWIGKITQVVIVPACYFHMRAIEQKQLAASGKIIFEVQFD